jgi:phage baseplate assembly protein W
MLFRRRPISLILSVLLSPMGRGSGMIRCAMLAVTLPAGGTAALDAPGGLTIHGDVTVNGSLTASGDVVGRGFPQGPPAFRRAGRQWPDRGAGLMAGMARDTGAALDGLDHIRQSVADILSTPMGTRVGRRDYGSLVPELIDQPMTPANILRLYAATAVALTRWEDRLRLRRVGLVVGERPGSAQVVLDARRTDTASANALVRLSIPLTP